MAGPCPPLGHAPELCQLCGWALWLGLVLLLSSSLPRPELCQLCGWALWLGSVAGPCPPLVLLLAAPLNSVNSVAGLCGWALWPGLVLLLSSSWRGAPELCQLCGWALWLGLVLLSSVAGLCVQALSSSCPPLGRAPGLCQLCGWALWLGSVAGLVAGPCPPPLVLLLSSWRAGLCVQALPSCCPSLGRAPELCGWSLWPGLLERSVAEQIAMSMPTKIH